MPETFPEEKTPVPTEIGGLRIILTVPSGGTGADTRGEYRFEVLDQDGERMAVREGDLRPHLTAQEKQNVAGFMDSLLDKARASLPTTD